MIFHILAFLLFIFMMGISYYSIKKQYFNNEQLIKYLAIFLLGYKAIELGVGMFVLGNWAKYPVEYSTIFYFFFPIIILTNVKRLRGPATTGAFISGLGYLITLIFNINNMIETQSAINNMHGFLIGMLSHSILFYLSIMMMTKYKFEYKKEVLWTNVIAIIILVHAAIMGTFIDFTEYYLFVYLLNSGALFPFLQNKGPFIFFFNFVFIAIIYNAVIIGFYKLNDALHTKFNPVEISLETEIM